MPPNSTPIQLVQIPYEDLVAIPVERLDHGIFNYPIWSDDITDLLSLFGLSGYISGEIACPNEIDDPLSYRNWIANDHIVRTLLERYSSECTWSQYGGHEGKTAQETWNALKSEFSKNMVSDQMSLLSQLSRVRYSESEPFSTTTTRIQRLRCLIDAHGPRTKEALFVSAAMTALDGSPYKDLRPHIIDRIWESPGRSPAEAVQDLLGAWPQVLRLRSSTSTSDVSSSSSPGTVTQSGSSLGTLLRSSAPSQPIDPPNDGRRRRRGNRI